MQSKDEGLRKAFLPDCGDYLRAIIYEVQSFPRGSRGEVSRCETVNDVSTHSSYTPSSLSELVNWVLHACCFAHCP